MWLYVYIYISMCLYVFNMSACLEENIYPHIEQGLVVKTPKWSDVLPLDSGVIDLVFWIFYCLLTYLYHISYVELFMCFKHFTLTVSYCKYPLRLYNGLCFLEQVFYKLPTVSLHA